MKLLKGRSYIHANIHIYMHIYVHIYVDRQIDRYVTLSNIHDRPSFEKPTNLNVWQGFKYTYYFTMSSKLFRVLK